MREAVQVAYNDMGGHEAFTAWAKKNPTEYYKIASRLIPLEIRETTDTTINIIINRGGTAPVLDAVPAIEHHENHEDLDNR